MNKKEREEWFLQYYQKYFLDKGITPKGANAAFLRSVGCGHLLEDKPHQFITVALPNDYDIEKIKKYINHPHAWCRGILSIEKYSKVGENLHLHILKEGNYSKTKVVRDLARKFKIAPNFIDVRRGNEQTDYDNRLSYIKGDKVDEAKMENVQKDKEWRIENSLENYYLLN